MITLYPDFYRRFRCKAGNCHHSCCVSDWDIDIDDVTADIYRTTDGPLGDELRRSMICRDGTFSFRMKKDGGCPFFREDGLCRIILEKGEDYLCDICTMHPRFFVYAGDFELAGVGLACEKSVELLLSDTGPLCFMEETGKSWTLPQIFHALGTEITEEALRFTPCTDLSYYKSLLSRLERTEPIDEAWTKRLSFLEKKLAKPLRRRLSGATLKRKGVSLDWPHVRVTPAAKGDPPGLWGTLHKKEFSLFFFLPLLFFFFFSPKNSSLFFAA